VHDLGGGDCEVDRARQPGRLLEARLGRAPAVDPRALAGGMNDEAAPLGLARREVARLFGGRFGLGRGLAAGLLAPAAQASAPSLSPSNSAIGPVGMTVEIACL
jgi:hypothetical protein